MRAARPWLLFAALLAVAGLLAALGGFAYGHEPQRDVLELTVERTMAAEGADQDTDPKALRGRLIEVGDDRLLLNTNVDTVELPLSLDVIIEELRRVTDASGELQPGTSVNLGGERTDVGPILTGVVVLDAVADVDR